ncbi:MAG TPA: HAD-IA family hydrolase [Candidatus Limnocylindrales bacterium]|nr:HAD-IA family hydrolase [Candidatus Limnocylindrales bacterium]
MEAVIFDWDGTLVDSLPAIYQANVEVLAEIRVPFDIDRYRAAYVPDWRLMYTRLGVPPEHLERAGERWRELYATAVAPVAFAGVRDALGRLAKAGHALGLVTAGDRDVVEEQLERLALASLIRVLVCGTDEVAHKPHPDPLLLALQGLGMRDRPGVAAYVGDAPDDMRMARTVGTRAIGIVSTLGTEADLRAAGADEVAPSVVDWVDRYLPK